MKDIKTMEIAELVKKAVEMKEAKDDIIAGLDVINDELKERLIKMKVTGMRVDRHFLSQVKRISVTDVTFSKAKELGATKEAIDGEKLRKLYESGVKIKGIRTNISIRITEAKDE